MQRVVEARRMVVLLEGEWRSQVWVGVVVEVWLGRMSLGVWVGGREAERDDG